MAKGHRSQLKKERNKTQVDKRPRAVLKFARISDRKARIVLEQIKGKDVHTAAAIVAYSPRYAADLISKLLKSAVANAENNLGMDADNLYVAEVYADQGPTFKRIRPRAKGSAYRILKKTSHISIVLDERNEN